MSRLYKVKFFCSLGVVGATFYSAEELQKAFNWFSKRYQDAKILFCKEVLEDAKSEEKLH